MSFSLEISREKEANRRGRLEPMRWIGNSLLLLKSEFLASFPVTHYALFPSSDLPSFKFYVFFRLIISAATC